MSIRRELEKLIFVKAEERGLELTDVELLNAISGVEYWFNETVYDSIDTALNNVEYDREFYVEVKFFLMGDVSGELCTKEFDNAETYAGWLEDMKGSIEIFSEKF
jgi:hypothetical protein